MPQHRIPSAELKLEGKEVEAVYMAIDSEIDTLCDDPDSAMQEHVGRLRDVRYRLKEQLGRPLCTACGELATHLWGALDTKTWQVPTLNGLGHLTPSCDSCGASDESGQEDGVVIRVPLPKQ